MNNLLSYFGLVGVRMNASDKDLPVNNSIADIAADPDIVNCFDWIFDEFIFFFFWGMVLFDMFVQKVKGAKWNRMTVGTQKYQVILGLL